MDKAGLIEQAFQKKQITKRQRDTMMRHMAHHSLAHTRAMLEQMSRGGAGRSFTEAHRMAMAKVGK